MEETIPEIIVERNKKTVIGPYFKHAVGGKDIKQKTIERCPYTSIPICITEI